MESFSYIANAPKAVISSKYGYRTHPITGKKNVMHYGLDIAHPTGTQVLAMADGVIIDSKMANNSCGGTIAVDHGEINGKKIKTRFCHNSKLLKKTGDQVKKGDVIAISGGGRKDPGRGGSTGSHIHFEVYENGKPVNPISYYNGTVGYKKSKTIVPQTKNSEVSGEEDLPIPDEDDSVNIEPDLPTETKGLDLFGGKLNPLIKAFGKAFGQFGGMKPIIGGVSTAAIADEIMGNKELKNYENSSIFKSPTKSKSKESSNEISKLPKNIQNSISQLNKSYGIKITDEHIKRELEQEGGYREDSGGVNSEASEQINKLIRDVKNKFPKLKNITGIISDYRSYSDQVKNFGSKAKSRGIDETQRANAIPGFSQHHTGKAFDIFSVDTSWWNKNSDVKDWVAKNASKYGFDVTYKKQGSLRIAEPWHLYYVGGGVNEQNLIKDKIVKEEIDRIKQLMK